MIYLLLRSFLFWQCYCQDPVHPGDEPSCPKHGWPRTVRFFVVLALIVLTLWRSFP